MRKYILTFVLSQLISLGFSQSEFTTIEIDSEITKVQPMTGIVFWPGNSQINTDAIALEYSYMDFSEIVTSKGIYDWTVVEELLDEVASRNHQTVLRFRYSYPGRTTTVPQYIKDLPDYQETEGVSEGQTTWFPDWTNEELQRFTLEFYQKYGEQYDDDPRLAFIQVGFGLWAEYHIYDGPFVLGSTFPSKAFQKSFFQNMDNSFENTFWSISIDAASSTYSPFEQDQNLKNISFGLFDDSFMHADHGDYNTWGWNFFDRERYRWAPAGGEFSYYTTFDQQHVLTEYTGAHGVPYELFAQDFHITYMTGNDQPGYQSLDRIKTASMNSGYKFKLNSFQTKQGSSIIEVVNLGVAPIYIDAYLTVNGVRSTESLKFLGPDEIKIFNIAAGGTNPVLTIESDDILPTEEIQFYGTVNDYQRYQLPGTVPVTTIPTEDNPFKVCPTIVANNNNSIQIKHQEQNQFDYVLYNRNGEELIDRLAEGSTSFSTYNFPKGIYFLKLKTDNNQIFIQKIVIQ